MNSVIIIIIISSHEEVHKSQFVQRILSMLVIEIAFKYLALEKKVGQQMFMFVKQLLDKTLLQLDTHL